MSAVLRVSALLSSHSTFRASRPLMAAWVVVASTATPCGTITTSCTPFTAFAAVASKLLGAAPKRGGWATTATSMSGSLRSWV